MLLTDSDIVLLADLQQIDSEIVSVAMTAKPAITISGDGSVIRQAWAECAAHLTSRLQSFMSYLASPSLSAGHVMAVMNTGIPARSQARVSLSQIVAHDPYFAGSTSPLKLWMVYRTLALLYRDASSRLGKDRFEEKAERYRDECDRAWGNLQNAGIPCVNYPMEAPGARHAFGAGSFSASAISGSGSGTRTFDLALTYYDGSKYVSASNTGNAESAPSERVTVQLVNAQAIRVDITSLNPPNGTMPAFGLAQAYYSPLNATHWSIYAGPTGGDLYYQTSVPIATKTYTFGADPATSGRIAGNGQWPDVNVFFHNLAMRA